MRKLKYTDEQRNKVMQLFETQRNLSPVDIAKQCEMSYGQLWPKSANTSKQSSMQRDLIRIVKITLTNGNNWPVVRLFECDKVIDRTEVKVYKKRLKSVFEKRYNKSLAIDFTYCEAGSIYPKEPEK